MKYLALLFFTIMTVGFITSVRALIQSKVLTPSLYVNLYMDIFLMIGFLVAFICLASGCVPP